MRREKGENAGGDRDKETSDGEREEKREIYRRKRRGMGFIWFVWVVLRDRW